MSIVLDSSATLAWYFEDERTDSLTDLLHHVAEAGAVAPALWRFEVANGLWAAMRRKRIDGAYRDRALANLAALGVEIDMEGHDHAWSATVWLSDRYGLTVYDAAYVELAQRRRLALATLDAALAQAARSAGVTLLL